MNRAKEAKGPLCLGGLLTFSETRSNVKIKPEDIKEVISSQTEKGVQ